MFIRYVIGRPAVPAEPKILKAGGVSRDLRRDTTLELYLRACDHEQVTPNVDYVHHLKARDSIAWQYRLDIFAASVCSLPAKISSRYCQAIESRAFRWCT